MMRFAQPWALAALAVLPLLAWWWWRARRRGGGVRFSDLGLAREAPVTWRVRLAWLPRALRLAVLFLAIVAMARPQAGTRQSDVSTEGVDVMLILDRSGSMQAMDFSPNRLGKAKQVMRKFVEGRPNDRLGLVAFAQASFTACPLTLDHSALLTVLDGMDFAPPDESGTAIGLGLASAVNRLIESPAKSRVAVLVTDGVNNAGSIDPLTAADLAHQEGITIYTIGVGTHGYAPVPRYDMRGRMLVDQQGRPITAPMAVEIDEPTLREVASRTGGQYFRATNATDLEQIFARIDRLEKSEIHSTVWVAWEDRFAWFLLPSAALFGAEMLLSVLLLRRLP
jgi:Ca-activated chloride channel family protein